LHLVVWFIWIVWWCTDLQTLNLKDIFNYITYGKSLSQSCPLDLFIAVVDDVSCTWSYWVTHTRARMHTHPLGKITLDKESALSQRPLPVQHTTFTRDKNPCPGEIWTSKPSKRDAANPRLRPHGHWNWSKVFFFYFIRQIHLDNLECHLIGYDIVQNGRSFQPCGHI